LRERDVHYVPATKLPEPSIHQHVGLERRHLEARSVEYQWGAVAVIVLFKCCPLQAVVLQGWRHDDGAFEAMRIIHVHEGEILNESEPEPLLCSSPAVSRPEVEVEVVVFNVHDCTLIATATKRDQGGG
jgi:hypothetical protein